MATVASRPMSRCASIAAARPVERDADVGEVRVLHRPRAEHTVRVHDRIRFAPGDLLAGGGCGVEQVRSTGERRPHSHPHVCVTDTCRRFAELGIDALRSPSLGVDRRCIRGRWDLDASSPVGEGLGELQARRTGVEATVDVGLLDVDQFGRALCGGEADDDPHGCLRRDAVGAGQHHPVLPSELHLATDRRAGDGGDRDVTSGAELGELLGADADDRDRGIEDLVGDDRAEGEDRVGVFEDEGRRGHPVHDQFEDAAASGARAATARHHHDATGDDLAAQGMVPIDDLAGVGVDAHPEAQRDIGEQHAARGRSRARGIDRESRCPPLDPRTPRRLAEFSAFSLLTVTLSI